MTDKITIGKRIRFQRELLGLTQDELGQRMGVTPNAITQYEKGTRELKSSELSRLADELGVKVGYFYGEDKPPPMVVDIDAQGNITRTQAITGDDAAEIKRELREIRETLNKMAQQSSKSDGNKPA